MIRTALSTVAIGWAAVSLGACPLPAQTAVTLRLEPRLGDTLHMRLDQQMEMRGRPQDGVEGERTIRNALHVRARAIPARRTGSATILTTITDSLVVSSPLGPAELMDRARRSLLGRAVAVRVLPDGAMEVLDQELHDDDPSPLFGHMPPVFPSVEVSPGDQWVREMRLPLRGSRSAATSVRATFRLDSLGRDGRIAYISVRGAFYERASTAGEAERPLEGSLAGMMEFDRQLGWIRDSRTTITMRSEVRGPDPRTGPMEVWMRITQRLQARTSQ
jgi:hypothetical protein